MNCSEAKNERQKVKHEISESWKSRSIMSVGTKVLLICTTVYSTKREHVRTHVHTWTPWVSWSSADPTVVWGIN